MREKFKRRWFEIGWDLQNEKGFEKNWKISKSLFSKPTFIQDEINSSFQKMIFYAGSVF